MFPREGLRHFSHIGQNRVEMLTFGLLVLVSFVPTPESRSFQLIPKYGSRCDNETWESQVEKIYDRDRGSIEGFNAFLKAIAERNGLEERLKETKASRDGLLCDFNSTEVLSCDASRTCVCGGKWQKYRNKGVRVNGTSGKALGYECRAMLYSKCRVEADSPFRQFHGWSPCEEGAVCVASNHSMDIVLQKIPKYGQCVCDRANYNVTKRNPIRQCYCAIVRCKGPKGTSGTILIIALPILTYFITTAT